jgi:lincosamide nucleotidyltransferase A/C/D/E
MPRWIFSSYSRMLESKCGSTAVGPWMRLSASRRAPTRTSILSFASRTLPTLRQVLGSRGFSVQEGGTESNFVLADVSGRELDVHAIVFDQTGNGAYRTQNGSIWIFPAAGFGGRGEIQGLNARCLSPEVQVLCHAQGYVPAEKDLRDMELLQARFGVELPAHLRRQR